MDIRSSAYFKQVDLLLTVLPIVSRTEDFALKGGTAINLFVQDFPRLSVDIDLTYLPIQDRLTTLTKIDLHLKEIGSRCKKFIAGAEINYKTKGSLSYGLIINCGQIVVKIEPNLTIRGSVYPPVKLPLAKKVEEMFGKTMEVRTLSVEDLYAGKLCAALDRQHPRDLFDVHHLYKNAGITDKVRQAFIVYLLSHNRPIAELLDPKLKDDLEETFHESFEGMAFEPVKLDDLVESWKMVVQKLNQDFTEGEREFILSFKQGFPKWHLFPHSEIQSLPGIRWKMANLEKMNPKKHKAACEKLQQILWRDWG
ncbi:putative nucleotidyltransferase component of viral defense system [Cyclonatronum proteinivorum]|uniref:Putative nucleotidyltransferase component of viral defense system n=1 Tax=Cyclonatronum proteinivorum TaxID=1457365 RepID=A0A345UK99_9BACT|nr:nucleotidyl transferase AbiEii/AbiGii toxin family protein [Cyclonatronum proteinivorum]AXJ00901.1 putative nucleotidyltransferase component of viral defense system [Cyclonatronum proteinivorum]